MHQLIPRRASESAKINRTSWQTWEVTMQHTTPSSHFLYQEMSENKLKYKFNINKAEVMVTSQSWSRWIWSARKKCATHQKFKKLAQSIVRPTSVFGSSPNFKDPWKDPQVSHLPSPSTGPSLLHCQSLANRCASLSGWLPMLQQEPVDKNDEQRQTWKATMRNTTPCSHFLYQEI